MVFIQTQLPQSLAPVKENYFTLLMKGGWIIVPLLILSVLTVYLIVDRALVFIRLGRKDAEWFNYIRDLIYSGDIENAALRSKERDYAYGKVIAAGIYSYESSDEEIQDNMQTAAREQVSRLENQMNYLGIIASIAPMLGFLGTIFGVIKIFYNISVTNDLSIASISDGLYQKMICSGVGLLVGIVAYSGYHILNGYVDKIVLNIDKNSNEILNAVRAYKAYKKM